MPAVVPLTDYGARSVTIVSAGRYLKFRTYYTYGQIPVWLMDVMNLDNLPLITGIALVPGSDNVFKGMGDTLNGFQLYILAMDNMPEAMNALGNTLYAILYEPGEENLYIPGDPMMAIPPHKTYYPPEVA